MTVLLLIILIETPNVAYIHPTGYEIVEESLEADHKGKVPGA